MIIVGMCRAPLPQCCLRTYLLQLLSLAPSRFISLLSRIGCNSLLVVDSPFVYELNSCMFISGAPPYSVLCRIKKIFCSNTLFCVSMLFWLEQDSYWVHCMYSIIHAHTFIHIYLHILTYINEYMYIDIFT